MSMSWEQTIVAELRTMKLEGYAFVDAWATAIATYPPRGRYAGPSQMELGGETLADFLERACRDAWHGERPALAHLSSALGDVGQDRSSYARGRSHRTGKQAA